MPQQRLRSWVGDAVPERLALAPVGDEPTPLSLAVVFAMLASHALSRTLTPITIGLLLRGEHVGVQDGPPRGLFARFHAAFERGFEGMRQGYVRLLTSLVNRRAVVPVIAALALGLGAAMFRLVGRDYFPLIDAGQIQLHVRGPAGMRIESTERLFQAVEDKIREIIPESERELIVDNIGLPARAYNLAFTDGSTIGGNDGIILVSLKEGHAPTADYIRKLRELLPATFPESIFYFQPADIVTQILNFGVPSQINVRTVGYDRATNLRVAQELRRRIADIPGIVDAHLQQEVDAPAFFATIDRARAAQLGLNANTMATNVNISLSSSEQVTPNFWTDSSSGIPYYFAVQTPEREVSSLSALQNTPVSTAVTGADTPVPGVLSNVATLKRDSVPTNANQTNIQPVYEVYAGVQGTDLGGVASEIGKIVAELETQLAPGNSIQVVGQIQSMNEAFRGLGIGMLFAAVLVYLLMVVKLAEFRRSFGGDPGAAGDVLRHSHHAVRDRHDPQRPLVNGGYHGGRCRFRKFHPARHFRARAATGRQERIRCCH
jgi:multidrug efflux pump subunit AcrB